MSTKAAENTICMTAVSWVPPEIAACNKDHSASQMIIRALERSLLCILSQPTRSEYNVDHQGW
jgi:hypothetical protein